MHNFIDEAVAFLIIGTLLSFVVNPKKRIWKGSFKLQKGSLDKAPVEEKELVK